MADLNGVWLRYFQERAMQENAEASVALSHREGCDCSVCLRVQARIAKRYTEKRGS